MTPKQRRLESERIAKEIINSALPNREKRKAIAYQLRAWRDEGFKDGYFGWLSQSVAPEKSA